MLIVARNDPAPIDVSTRPDDPGDNEWARSHLFASRASGARCGVTGADQRPTDAVRERWAARRSLPNADARLTQKATLLCGVAK